MGYYNSAVAPGLACAACTVISVHCNRCSDGTTCSVCATGYATPTCANCATGYTGAGCATCDVGYYNNAGTCDSCSAVSVHCNVCSSSAACTTCAVGFTGTLCDTCDVGYSGANCNVCTTGYYSNNGACSPCTSNVNSQCLECSSISLCTRCATGFTGSTCTQCAPGYTNATSFPNCSVCQPGYYSFNSTCLTCTVISSNCNICNNGVFCTTCTPGYTGSACELCLSNYYSSAASPLVCNACSVINVNCNECSNGTVCSVCAIGFATPLCNTCAVGYTGTGCAVCDVGFFSNNGTCDTCKIISNNCNTCNNGATCGTCAVGYKGTACESCSTGYYNSSTINNTLTCSPCSIINVGCRQCNSGTVCSVCAIGFATPNCLSCATGYVGSVCSICDVGYYLENGTCNSCPAAITNCVTCSSGISCTTCATGYAGTTCSTCAAGYSGSNCSTCVTGYYSNSGLCSICTVVSPHCNQCSNGINCSVCATGYTGSTCGSCVTGYFISSSAPFTCSSCSQISTNCNLCSNGTICSTCALGYSGATCSMCILNYGYASSVCTPCSAGFSSMGGTSSCFNSSTPQPTTSSTNTTALASSAGITVSSSLTLATPPTINSTVLSTLPFSSNTFITANDRLESFTITQSASSATFQVFAFNHSFANNLNTLSISNISGQWSFVKSSSSNLSCVFVSTATQLSALLFDSDANTFTTYSSLSISSLPFTNTSSMVVGEKCSLILGGTTVYSLTANAMRSIRNFTSIQASSSSLQFIISGSALFYNINGAYVDLAAGLATYPNYMLKVYGNLLIISGFSSTSTVVNSTTLYTVTSTIYVGYISNNKYNSIQTISISSTNSPINFVRTSVSPMLTRIHYQYYSNGVLINVLKRIDFVGLTVQDITFQSQTQFSVTTSAITAFTSANYYLSDNYLVIRNDSSVSTPNSGVFVEQAYQFVSSVLIYMRTRTLSAAQSADCFRTYVDSFYTDNLMVLDLYSDGAVNLGYNIYQFSYGNLASTIKVIPVASLPYLTFTPSTFSSSKASSSQYQWFYINTGASAISSSVTLYSQVDSLTSHLSTGVISITFTGLCSILATSSKCMIISQGTSSYLLYSFTSTTVNTTFTNTNITYFAGISSVTGSTVWNINNDCSKFSIGSQIFAYTVAAAGFALVGNLNNFAWTALDSSFTYGLAPGAIFKYSSSSNIYKSYYSLDTTFSTASNIVSSSSNIAVYKLTSTSATLSAFYDNGTALTLVLSLSLTFVATPKITFSPQLSMLVIYGKDANGASLNFYYVDFAGSTYEQIDFPTESVFDPLNVYMELEETWLYVRQLKSSLQTVTGGNQEFAYYIQYNSILSLSKSQNIAQSNQNNWVNTIISTASTGNLKVFTQIAQTAPASGNTPIVVTDYEVGATQTTSLGGNYVDGEIQLCVAGCYDCSQGYCTDCYDGYALDSNSNTCLVCGMNCLTCSSSNTDDCYTCASGSYLSGTICASCDPVCLTCQNSATSCISCLPGKFYNSTLGQCTSCSRNCISCTASVCTSCRTGFVVSGTSCLSCVSSCSTCLPSDITTCTSCYAGLQLINGACVPCPDKCTTCKSGVCVTCISGYHPNAAGTCVLNCVLPCQTCVDNSPSTCLSCYSGSKLVNSKCKQDLTCNTYNNCTGCGQGTNYILVGANCLSCGSIPNCLQCRPTNSYACSVCSTGYFINNADTCTACPSSCISCISASICTACAIGYTFAAGYTQSQCLACTSPCSTCYGSQNYCTSCISGYSKLGWKCQSNKNVGFGINLNSNNITAVLADVSKIVADILKFLNISSTQVDAVTFTTIKYGSVVASGTATPSDTSSSSIVSSAAALSSGLSGSSIGGFTVSSTSVVANGVSSSDSSSSNLPLIIGLAVGIPILAVIVIAVACYIYRQKKAQAQSSNESQAHIMMDATLDKVHNKQTDVKLPYEKEMKDNDIIYELEINEGSDISDAQEITNGGLTKISFYPDRTGQTAFENTKNRSEENTLNYGSTAKKHEQNHEVIDLGKTPEILQMQAKARATANSCQQVRVKSSEAKRISKRNQRMQVVEKNEESRDYPLNNDEKHYEIVQMEPQFPSKQEIKYTKSGFFQQNELVSFSSEKNSHTQGYLFEVQLNGGSSDSQDIQDRSRPSSAILKETTSDNDSNFIYEEQINPASHAKHL